MTNTRTYDSWPGGNDDDPWPLLGWDDDEHAEWLEKWAPRCPESRPQAVRHCLGYREREPGRLQLRVALTGDEGVCHALVDERDDSIHVRLLVCYGDDDVLDPKREYCNCPVHVYLEQPLNGRKVIDIETNGEVPLFVPTWGESRGVG